MLVWKMMVLHIVTTFIYRVKDSIHEKENIKKNIIIEPTFEKSIFLQQYNLENSVTRGTQIFCNVLWYVIS